MSTIFLVLLLLSFLSFFFGLAKPSWVRMPSRKRASLVFGIGTVAFFILFGVTAPPSPYDRPAQAVSQSTPTTTAETVTSTITNPTATTADPIKVAAASLASTTDDYAALYANAKNILGTTPYADADVGLQAMDDPNSAAVRFGAFRTDTCIKNDPGAAAIATYTDVSNLYDAANMDRPDALGNWNYDMATLAADICLWAGDGVSWQIKEISTARLHSDESKISADLSAARADIKAL